MKVRIDAACNHLAVKQAPIVQIPLDCGYSDQSAFSRQFKQAVGTSPMAYRKRFAGWNLPGASASIGRKGASPAE